MNYEYPMSHWPPIVTDGLLHWNARDTQVDFEDEQYKFNELDPHEWSENIQIFPKI